METSVSQVRFRRLKWIELNCSINQGRQKLGHGFKSIDTYFPSQVGSFKRLCLSQSDSVSLRGVHESKLLS